MDMVLAVLVGLGLSAACGLRVFVPLLVLSIAAKAGALSLGPSFAWLGSTEALTAFGLATVLEVVAYKVPWLDHALDTVASPAAVLAGTLVSASQIGAVHGMHPVVQWSCALILGGGIAGLVQTGSVATRAASTVSTGGLANPIVSAFESIMAVVVSVLAVIVPVLTGLAVLVLVALAAWIIVRWRRSRRLRPERVNCRPIAA